MKEDRKDDKGGSPTDARASHRRAEPTSAVDGGATAAELAGTYADAISQQNPADVPNEDVLPPRSRLQGNRDYSDRPSEKTGRGAADLTPGPVEGERGRKK